VAVAGARLDAAGARADAAVAPDPAREPASQAAPRKPGPHVAVVGAGAFGGWTALMLLRKGARVTLLDAWGPGNPRASSHGETRVIRAMYGGDRAMTAMAARALTLWGEKPAPLRRAAVPPHRRAVDDRRGRLVRAERGAAASR
jgi:glycine/D-amino acid oxidase-like deaminating enzyme